jgi:hypothetical protein
MGKDGGRADAKKSGGEKANGQGGFYLDGVGLGWVGGGTWNI